MTLNLYDTATREISEFKPLEAGKVSIYVCGATVQSYPHIGHVRSGINFDILRRWLMKNGYDVTFIRNVTDIDDKILHKAVHEEMPWWALAMKYERMVKRGQVAKRSQGLTDALISQLGLLCRIFTGENSKIFIFHY